MGRHIVLPPGDRATCGKRTFVGVKAINLIVIVGAPASESVSFPDAHAAPVTTSSAAQVATRVALRFMWKSLLGKPFPDEFKVGVHMVFGTARSSG